MFIHLARVSRNKAVTVHRVRSPLWYVFLSFFTVAFSFPFKRKHSLQEGSFFWTWAITFPLSVFPATKGGLPLKPKQRE